MLRSEGREPKPDDLSLAALLRLVVLPVVEQLLRDGEAEYIAVQRIDEQPNQEIRVVDLRLVGETFRWYASVPGQQSESAAQMRARLASELHDFISESTFAWGESRPWTDESPDN